MVGYYFRIFIVFYFIIILIQAFWFNFYNLFTFKTHSTKNSPLCNDFKLICQCNYFVVTVTLVVNSPQHTISSGSVSCIFFSDLFDEYINDITICLLVGFRISVQSLYYTVYFDDEHIGLVVVIWSLMVFNEHKVKARFRCKKSGKWRKNVDCHFKTVDDANSVITCHFEAHEKSNYPSRHIFLIFWKMKNVGNHCERSMVITLSWVEVVHHKIFLMRPVFFWYIANEVKYWWFDMDYSLTDYSYMKKFIEFFVAITVK